MRVTFGKLGVGPGQNPGFDKQLLFAEADLMSFHFGV